MMYHRGHAWAILGFTQTYAWTRDQTFLATAKGCADLLIKKLLACVGTHHHPYVLPWDFDAPSPSPGEPLRDSSAAMIAAVALLHLHACLKGEPLVGNTEHSPPEEGYDGEYFDVAVRIAEETLDLCLDRDFASFIGTALTDGSVTNTNVDFPIRESAFDAILRHATAQNSPQAFTQIANHGSVYADYFLLEFGNLLLKLTK